MIFFCTLLMSSWRLSLPMYEAWSLMVCSALCKVPPKLFRQLWNFFSNSVREAHCSRLKQKHETNAYCSVWFQHYTKRFSIIMRFWFTYQWPICVRFPIASATRWGLCLMCLHLADHQSLSGVQAVYSPCLSESAVWERERCRWDYEHSFSISFGYFSYSWAATPYWLKSMGERAFCDPAL